MSSTEAVRQWRLRNPDRLALHRKREKLAKYGLTPDQFDAMSEDQDGRCAVCAEERKLSVDHDHETGEVRGLLCVPCNGWLGFVEKYLPAAQAYLGQS